MIGKTRFEERTTRMARTLPKHPVSRGRDAIAWVALGVAVGGCGGEPEPDPQVEMQQLEKRADDYGARIEAITPAE
jgi:hypothetical protein